MLDIFVSRPQIGVWQIKMEEALKQYTTFTVGNFGVFQMHPHALWPVQCNCHISETDAKLSQQVKPHLLPHLLR